MPPTLFQRKMLWAAITAFSFVVIGAVIALVGWLFGSAISFLQPVLIPVAIAAILAYLLEPVVRWLAERRFFTRTRAVVAVFLTVTLVVGGILIWIVPAIWRQGKELGDNLPKYTRQTQDLFDKTLTEAKRLVEPVLQKSAHPENQTATENYVMTLVNDGTAALKEKFPDMANSTGAFLKRSLGGFLGIFGFILSLVLVPIFLFFFLKEGPSITRNWSKYLPLRASPLKSEIVSLLSEINTYLINFFRGQLIVSIIDGVLIGFSLLIFVRLEFALLIGLFVAVLGLIPYIGMMICWVPAVLIATAQFGDWWHPLLVTIIFIVANNLDGMLIAPKIVGESVGLHPLTVIFSVLAWSLILGGLLGALLAVPLTATLKVVLKRYFWDRPSSTTAPPVPTTP